MSWNYQTQLYKSRSHEDDFTSKFRCRRVADNEFPTCVTFHEQLRTLKLVLVFVLVLEAKAL